ncbi:MAG: leucine-rich repeat domain-containing protein, partial [Flavonifractor sp.]|nr:leucine-rich repeat domain-containing protein [Flavonifractor sp.]
ERMVAQADAPLLLNACKKGRNAAAKAAVAEYVRENFESHAPAEGRKKRAPEPAGAPKEKRPKDTGKSGPTVAEMKKLWSFKKRADGSLVLTGYKGTDKEVVIPERIGKTSVTALSGAVRKNIWDCGIFGYFGHETTAITIPDSVTSISNYAFQGLINVKNLRIPPQLTEIGLGAFSNCQLTEARIPQGITEIGERAFLECKALEQVELPQSLKRIRAYAFCCCGLTSVVVPAHVEEIECGAFKRCVALHSVVLPEGLRVIGDDAFSNCKALKTVVLPEGLRVIGSDAFAGCKALKTVVLPEGLEILKNRAFAETGITSLVIPKSVKQLDGDPFFCCEDLKDVTILAGMEYLPDGLFVVSGITGAHYNVTIHAPAGSAAEDFAKRNNLKFAAL